MPSHENGLHNYSPLNEVRMSRKYDRVHLSDKAASSSGLDDYEGIQHDESEGPCGWCCSAFLMLISFLLILMGFPFSLILCFKTAREYERAVVFRLGRLREGRPIGPGLFSVIPCTDKTVLVDMRTNSLNVPPQEILTKDMVTITVDAVVYYAIQDPVASVLSIKDPHLSTSLLARTTLRTVLGLMQLSEVLSERESIGGQMQASLDKITTEWGVKVDRVEVRDVRLPVELQHAMAAEAEAAREARAKVIAAEGEQNSAIAYAEAADIMAQEPGALQLRYLQTLQTTAGEKESTILFPLPLADMGFAQLSPEYAMRHRKSEEPLIDLSP